MNANFNYHKLSTKHKRKFISYQMILFLVIAIMAGIALAITDPEVVDPSDKMSLTIGVTLVLSIVGLAFLNRLKSLLKIKFVVFLIAFVILFSLQMIMTTLIWTIGLVLIPLMIDDLIIVPLWNNLWYNIYE